MGKDIAKIGLGELSTALGGVDRFAAQLTEGVCVHNDRLTVPACRHQITAWSALGGYVYTVSPIAPAEAVKKL